MTKERSINRLVWSILVLGIAMPLATGQTTVARTAVSAHRVADAMGRAGVAVDPRQIEFLSGESNLGDSATVQVLSVTHRTAGDSKVKLRCRDNHQCLPFYVLVHGLDKVLVESRAVLAVRVAAASSPQNLVRNGERATLVLESADSRMSLPVVCLQSGVRGQTIRVASPDHKHFFNAEITSAGTLRGRL